MQTDGGDGRLGGRARPVPRAQPAPPAGPRRRRPRIEVARRRLRQSAERLVRLLELQAPETIVANEVALLLRQGLCPPPHLGDLPGRRMMARARLQGGLCM